MSSRFEWKSLLLAALALFIALQAQIALGGPRPVDGLALYAAAVILFVSVCGGHLAALSRPAAHSPRAPASNLAGKPRVLRVLVLLAVILSAAGLAAFRLGGRDDWGWTLHLLSLLLLLAGVLPLPRPRSGGAAAWRGSLAHAIRPRGEWLPLLLILVLALAVRVWHNDSIPPGLYFDEAREGLVARRILAEPGYRPVYIATIERPAHHAYLVALSFAVFGDSIASLRLVPAAFGVLNVLAVFLLFNRWFGRKYHAGLIAAALWAFTRYDLTFSRILFDADSTPFFMMLTLFFLDRAFTRRQEATSLPRGGDSGKEPLPRRHTDFILAGLTLGIGQGFYLPMRIFAVLLVGLGLCLALCHVWRERSFSFLKPWVPQLLLFALALMLAVAPIAEFAVLEPDIVLNRNVTASIFYERAEPNLALALYTSTLKHLGMFNYQGDQNARHNLPGTPMLDPLSGVLFLLGLGLALRRCRDARNFVMLALFAGMLQAGILSTDWEAPQALRSIGVLPSVIFFMTVACLALAALLSRLSVRLFARRLTSVGPAVLDGGRLQVACAAIGPPRPDGVQQTRAPLLDGGRLQVVRAARQQSGVLLLALFVCALAVIAWLNLDLYFNRQAVDALVWRAHSSAEVWTASEMRRLSPTHDLILPAAYETSPTIKYLAPEIAPARTFTATDALPLSPVPTRPVALFLDSSLRDKLAEVRRVYPAALIRELRPPDNGEPVLYEIILDF